MGENGKPVYVYCPECKEGMIFWGILVCPTCYKNGKTVQLVERHKTKRIFAYGVIENGQSKIIPIEKSKNFKK